MGPGEEWDICPHFVSRVFQVSWLVKKPHMRCSPFITS